MDNELSDLVKENREASYLIDPKYQGIGGWLIFILIGLIITPIRLIILLITTYVPIFFDGSLQTLITPGTEVYSPLWIPMLFFEVFVNLFFIIYVVLLLIYFFKKKRTFPKLIIIYYLSNFSLVVIDYIISRFIPYLANQSSADSFTEISRSIGVCVIWIPYICNSKRVKSTFIN